MSLDEFTERFFSDGYKQQIADEENVPRSLPFFAAAFAVLVAIVGASKDALPPPSLHLFSVAVWALLTLLALCLLFSMVYLLLALWPRDFKYAMKETELHDWVQNLRQYYTFDESLTDEERSDAILEDIRESLNEQYRNAAVNNRAINFQRAAKRATALCLLVFALMFAFAMVGLILGHQEFDRASNDGRQRESGGSSETHTSAGFSGTSSQEAVRAAFAGNPKGCVDQPGKPSPAR